jgi:hypothetical protein
METLRYALKERRHGKRVNMTCKKRRENIEKKKKKRNIYFPNTSSEYIHKVSAPMYRH